LVSLRLSLNGYKESEVFQYKNVDQILGENQKEEYLALNPLGTIPLIQ
jgi:glutathione S-transferase